MRTGIQNRAPKASLMVALALSLAPMTAAAEAGAQSARPPREFVHAQWLAVPSPAFPLLAKTANVSSATVALNCEATVAGTLSDCRVLSESPPGYGFAEAALASTRAARIRPRMIDGEAVDSRMSFNVRFSLAD